MQLDLEDKLWRDEIYIELESGGQEENDSGITDVLSLIEEGPSSHSSFLLVKWR